MITLFGNLLSGNVHKAQMILRRRSIPFRRVDVSQVRGEPRTPEFLGVNPIGKIPAVLLEDGDVLSESGAILYYFAQGTELWPEDLRSQTEVLRWMFFEQYSHEPTLAVLRYLKRYAEGPQGDAHRIRELELKGLHALTVMRDRLTSANWIAAGKYPSIADYALYPYTRTANESGFRLAGFPALERWLGRVEAQPGFIPMLVDGAVETLSFANYFHAKV